MSLVRERTGREFKALPYKDGRTELEHLNLFLNLFQPTNCCGLDLCAALLRTAGKGNVCEGIHLYNTVSSHTDRCSYVAVQFC